MPVQFRGITDLLTCILLRCGRTSLQFSLINGTSTEKLAIKASRLKAERQQVYAPTMAMSLEQPLNIDAPAEPIDVVVEQMNPQVMEQITHEQTGVMQRN